MVLPIPFDSAKRGGEALWRARIAIMRGWPRVRHPVELHLHLGMEDSTNLVLPVRRLQR